MKYSLFLTDDPSDHIRQRILNPLVQFNVQHVGRSNHRLLVISINDERGQTIGGLWGQTSYGWLFIELLFVPDPLRSRGVGTKLTRWAEQEALKRGCHSGWVDTHEFQAKEFYEKMGYEVFGRLPDFPEGSSRFFLQKRLGARSSDQAGEK